MRRELRLTCAFVLLVAIPASAAARAAPISEPVEVASAGAAPDSEAQVVNPADKGKKAKPQAPGEQPAPDSDGAADEGQPPTRHTWEMPPVTVYGSAPLKEEDRIGAYGQPRWTAQRRFPGTRVYVIPSGTVGFEYWFQPKIARDGTTKMSNQYEIEFGLPGRIQIDLYAEGVKEGGTNDPIAFNQKTEFRWALADWGKIPGNPTIYLEWKWAGGEPDAVESKLLLGGEIASGWHWGSNLVWERQVGGEKENSYEWTTGISRTVRDMSSSVGLETKLAFVNAVGRDGQRGALSTRFLVGPSLQFRPLPQLHLDIAPLFGTTPSSPRSAVYVVLGYEF